jgi:Tfp pilus assembly protein PilF
LLLLVSAQAGVHGQVSNLSTARSAVERGDFQKAAALAKAYSAANPKSPEAKVILAQAALGSGDARTALTALRQALSLDPSSADALYYLAKLGAILSQQQLQQLYKVAPDSARVHQLMAEYHHAREDAAGEEKEYEEALKRDPRLVPALVGLGDLKRTGGDCDSAESHYRKALEINPRDYDGVYGIGACLLLADKFADSISYFQLARQIDPSSIAAGIALGQAQLRADQTVEGVTTLEAVVKSTPHAQQAWAMLAQAYQKMGRTEEAAAAFRKVKELAAREGRQAQ